MAEFFFMEKRQVPSWSSLAWSGLGPTEIYPSRRLLVTRDLQASYIRSQNRSVYQANMEVVAYSQDSVGFFVALFGTQTQPSVLDTPLKLNNACFFRKMPLDNRFEHIEDMGIVNFPPSCFLSRNGRQSDDLGLKKQHYFNGTHFPIAFQPVIDEGNVGRVRETIEEVIILRMSVLAQDALIFN
jgi:hypothetical protein